MSNQTNKNSLIIAGFIAILALTIASTPVRSFGFVLGDSNEEQKIEKAEDRSDEKQESEDLDDQDEDEKESEEEDQEDENDDAMEIKSINVIKEGKTTRLNRQVELKNSGKSTTIKTKSNTGVEEIQVEEKTEDDGQVRTEVQVETKNKNDEFKIKVRTGSNGFTIEDGKFAAKTNYPLSINSETNELTITTPAGSKVVTILPDQAIANMLRRGVLDIVNGNNDPEPSPSPSASPSTSPEPTSSPSASPSPEPITTEPEIELVTTSEGEVAYKFSGGKLKKLLGFIPVRIDKNILVSADTGEVVSDQPAGILDAFFDVLSTN